MENKLVYLIKSRKFWAALTGLAMIVLKAFKPDFPFSEDQITAMVVMLVGYIFGVAIEDAGAHIGTKS